LKDAEHVGYRAHLSLADLMRKQNRWNEADARLDEMLQKWPEPGTFMDVYQRKLAIRLEDEDRDGVIKVSSQARQEVEKDSQGKVTEDTQIFAFLASMGLLVTKSPEGEQVARDYLQTHDWNVPYITMLLHWQLAGKNKAEAQTVISDLWARYEPRSKTWEARLAQGDEGVWGEKLLNFYRQGKIPEEIFAELENPARFKDSDLKRLPKSRQSMLCEAYFYKALLAETNGDKADKDEYISSLKKAQATNVKSSFEHCMATFLLAQQSERK
jgi:hypothetical protein